MTFCPTSGRPYQDKPRFYLQRADFEQQRDNAFMVSRNGDAWTMDAMIDGTKHRIELNGGLDYTAPSFRARIDPRTFAVQHAETTRVDDIYPLEPCATMFVLLNGLRQSLPYLPTALPDAAPTAGRIAHPGYEE